MDGAGRRGSIALEKGRDDVYAATMKFRRIPIPLVLLDRRARPAFSGGVCRRPVPTFQISHHLLPSGHDRLDILERYEVKTFAPAREGS